MNINWDMAVQPINARPLAFLYIKINIIKIKDIKSTGMNIQIYSHTHILTYKHKTLKSATLTKAVLIAL